MVQAAKDRAVKHKIQFDLTVEYIQQMLEACNWRCYYSGVRMNLETGNGKGNFNHLKVSIDRIDSAKGYTANNIVLCCRIVNSMKSDLGVEEFLDWCKLIAANPRPYRASPNHT
jgi:hypothetical protein